MNLKIESTKPSPLSAVIVRKCWKLFVFFIGFFFLVYWLFGGAVSFLIFTAGAAVCFYGTQNQLLFHPDDNSCQSRLMVEAPSALDLPFENLFIRSLDGTIIHMYFIRQPEPAGSSAPTIIFFHGNAGNMGHRLQNAAGLYSILRCNILMVEYRGYGLSKGYPTEEGLYKDAQAAMDFLAFRPDVNQMRIVVFGRSLGGAVAIDLAARAEYSCRIWCLIVENTFTSIPDITVALFKFKWLNYVPLFAYKNKFMSKEKIDSVTVPTLFISGQSDSLVPPMMMSQLHALSPAPLKRLQLVLNGGHNDTWATPNYYANIASFLRSADQYSPSPPATTVANV